MILNARLTDVAEGEGQKSKAGFASRGDAGIRF